MPMFTTHLVYVSDARYPSPLFVCGSLFVSTLLQISFHISNLIKALLKLYTQKRKKCLQESLRPEGYKWPGQTCRENTNVLLGWRTLDLFVLMGFTSAAVFLYGESVEISGVCRCPEWVMVFGLRIHFMWMDLPRKAPSCVLRKRNTRFVYGLLLLKAAGYVMMTSISLACFMKWHC